MESTFEKNREYYLENLYLVGKKKPLGYLPLETIIKTGKSLDILIEELKAQGLQILLLNEEECTVYSGALYVFDESALQNLLNRNNKLLDDSGWPKIAKEFVLEVANKDVDFKINAELYDLIADAFADYTNRNRTEFRAKTLEKQEGFKKHFG